MPRCRGVDVCVKEIIAQTWSRCAVDVRVDEGWRGRRPLSAARPRAPVSSLQLLALLGARKYSIYRRDGGQATHLGTISTSGQRKQDHKTGSTDFHRYSGMRTSRVISLQECKSTIARRMWAIVHGRVPRPGADILARCTLWICALAGVFTAPLGREARGCRLLMLLRWWTRSCQHPHSALLSRSRLASSLSCDGRSWPRMPRYRISYNIEFILDIIPTPPRSAVC